MATGAGEIAGLRAFLRSRCGSVKAAFSSIDEHDVGQVTSDDFLKGLKRLGYSEDASTIFAALDTKKTGLINLKSFVQGMGERHTDSSEGGGQPFGRSSSEGGTWKTARITRHSSDNVLPSRPHLPKPPGREDQMDLSVGSVLRSSSALRSASTDQHDGTPCGSPMARSHQPVAGADLLYARMSRVEERVAAEQRLRGETEQRITQQLQQLVGVSISEQLDTLRQQLIDERMQRQVDINGIRASLETARLSRPSQMEESIKAEVERSVESVKMSLERTCSVARDTNAEAKNAEAMQRLEELCKDVEARLMSLEASEKEMACTSPSCSPKSPGRQGLRLERQVNTLQRGMDALQERLDDLSAKMQESTPASIPCDFDKVSSFVREKLDGLRVEWTKVMDEERERASLRSQALGRALTEEFEKSVVTQVIAEACTEARAFVGVELDARLQNINLSTCGKGTESVQTAIQKLSQDLEALRNLGFQQSCTGQDIFDRLKRLEDAQTEMAQLSGDTKEGSAAAEAATQTFLAEKLAEPLHNNLKAYDVHKRKIIL